MLLRRAARRLRPQTRGLSAMPTSFADYAEADETMQDYAGNVRRLGRLLGERVAASASAFSNRRPGRLCRAAAARTAAALTSVARISRNPAACAVPPG